MIWILRGGSSALNALLSVCFFRTFLLGFSFSVLFVLVGLFCPFLFSLVSWVALSFQVFRFSSSFSFFHVFHSFSHLVFVCFSFFSHLLMPRRPEHCSASRLKGVIRNNPETPNSSKHMNNLETLNASKRVCVAKCRQLSPTLCTNTPNCIWLAHLFCQRAHLHGGGRGRGTRFRVEPKQGRWGLLTPTPCE